MSHRGPNQRPLGRLLYEVDAGSYLEWCQTVGRDVNLPFTMPTPQHTLDILQSLGTELPGDFTSRSRSTVTEMRRAIDGGRDVFAYFNNHYAGFAPGSIDRLVKLWQESEGQTSVDR